MKIMIDIDGVMNNLLETACEMHGIDYNKVKCYSLGQCTEITPEERALIVGEFYNLECFVKSWIVPSSYEVELMRSLCANADVCIRSLSFTREIADFKLEQLLTYYPKLDEDNIILELVDESTDKTIEDYDIIIEDCFDNVVKARQVNPYCIGIIIDHLYNSSNVSALEDKTNMIVRQSFEEALQTALDLVYDDIELNKEDVEEDE